MSSLGFDAKVVFGAFNFHCFFQRVYGPEIQGKNFVFSAVKSAKAHKIINCQRNETSCPTYNVDLAAAALRLVETDSSGIYHCAGPEAMTKAEWARSIVSSGMQHSSNNLSFHTHILSALI